jgi:inositol-1,3,4-trisphosphate 5/6-kinase/inositol-tetrakisphosphate 1-kinase
MTVVVVPPSPPSPSPRFIVGYALTSKKIKSFIQPKLESHASTKGISLVAINRNKLLTEQGPFDVILHKITGKEWRQELEVRLVKRCGDREIDWERREHG